MALWTFNAGHRRFAFAGFAFLTLFLAIVLLVARQLRVGHQRAYARRGQDLAAYLQRYLVGRLWLTYVSAVVSAALGSLYPLARIHRHVGAAEWFGVILMTSMLGAVSLYLLVVRAPALRRELTALARH